MSSISSKKQTKTSLIGGHSKTNLYNTRNKKNFDKKEHLNIVYIHRPKLSATRILSGPTEETIWLWNSLGKKRRSYHTFIFPQRNKETSTQNFLIQAKRCFLIKTLLTFLTITVFQTSAQTHRQTRYRISLDKVRGH